MVVPVDGGVVVPVGGGVVVSGGVVEPPLPCLLGDFGVFLIAAARWTRVSRMLLLALARWPLAAAREATPPALLAPKVVAAMACEGSAMARAVASAVTARPRRGRRGVVAERFTRQVSSATGCRASPTGKIRT